MILRVPFKSTSEIRQAAEDVVALHLGSLRPPINVDLPVEAAFGLDIIPIPGYKSLAGVDGALSADLSSITIDQWVMEDRPNRYRFTLAHELGHRILHADLIGALVEHGTGHWKQAVQAIDAQSYSLIERQANLFAGHLPAPTQPLLDHYRVMAERALAHGIRLDEAGDYAMQQVAAAIADVFKVSAEVITIRLREAGILPTNR